MVDCTALWSVSMVLMGMMMICSSMLHSSTSCLPTTDAQSTKPSLPLPTQLRPFLALVRFWREYATAELVISIAASRNKKNRPYVTKPT